MQIFFRTGDRLSFLLLLTPFPLFSGIAQIAGITRLVSGFRWAVEI